MIAALTGTSSHQAPGANAPNGARFGVSGTQPALATTSPEAPGNAQGNPSSGASTGRPAAEKPAGQLIDLGTFNTASAAEEEETTDPSGLTEEERAQVDELKQNDRKVRAHEQAHAAAGGGHAGSPSYEYESGPDGNRYATSGEVPIDASPISGDPQATIQKMEIVRRAALAPAEPSPQDRAVAAKATQAQAQAQGELREQQVEEQRAVIEGDETGQAAGEGQGGGGQEATVRSLSGRAAGAYAQTARTTRIGGVASQIDIAA